MRLVDVDPPVDEEEGLSLSLVSTGCLLGLVDSALVLGVSVDLY